MNQNNEELVSNKRRTSNSSEKKSTILRRTFNANANENAKQNADAAVPNERKDSDFIRIVAPRSSFYFSAASKLYDLHV